MGFLLWLICPKGWLLRAQMELNNRLIQSLLGNMDSEWRSDITIDRSPDKWSLGYIPLGALCRPLLFDLAWGDPGASSGNPVASKRNTLALDRHHTLTTNLRYPSAINYELVVSFDVTLTVMGSVGTTRPEGGLKGFGLTFMEITSIPRCNPRSWSQILSSTILQISWRRWRS